ncbi:sugar kinase [Terrihabitans rhizophilus]|uniref:Sugar kinase n=1 Tax=Terrihabitans rhizophilus TaxID=3092662 RepID=A0ABU4RMZ7_9HYPH|nr:sugar kinase [Terrihabitans sp. PJ23]MDX6806198.1 sugar kinase [Terrihabitans sp. PJ23]
MKRLDILCIGEPLMEFAEVKRAGERLMLPGFGGDVMNVAVAAARQGGRVAAFTALGDDTFGREFLDLWDREGIDRSSVITRENGRTGVYFITYGPEGHEFTYARAGSAASLMTPDELPRDLLESTRVLHVSGISQAISADAADAVSSAIQQAKAAGALVSYDTNLRLRLWPLERARTVIHAAITNADIARPGLDDARQLTGLDTPDEIVDFYLKLGPRIVALTLGSEGCLVATREERRIVPGIRVEAVDASGAGDTFGGAFLAEYLRSGDPFTAARHANVAAALQTRGHGAVAPMPTRAEVDAVLAPPSSGTPS